MNIENMNLNPIEIPVPTHTESNFTPDQIISPKMTPHY